MTDTKPTLEFPNLEALAQGCMSGNFSEWPQLKVEAAKVVALLQSIRSADGPFNLIDAFNGRCPFPAWAPAGQVSQPDTVAVPRKQLEHWAEYWNGNANEKSMTDALEHILDEIDAVLQAAQEAK